MSRHDSKGPNDRVQAASPSPAREALKANLGTDAASTLSLKKRKSWFGSIRDVFQKGALQAKATVDSFRSDHRMPEHKVDTENSVDSESMPRPSMDSMTRSITSSTTLVRPGHKHHHSLLSRMPTASLRQHLPGHSCRHKRQSVYSFTGRPSSEMSHITVPEAFASPTSDGDTATHTRKSSVGGSIVGSIRGRLKPGKARMSPLPLTETPFEKPAESVPLPSSPIDIPAAAPALELDFGPTGLMSPTFGRQQAEEIFKSTDPANITTSVPRTELVLLPKSTPANIFMDGSFYNQPTKLTRPTTPNDLLRIPVDLGPSPPSAPSTPMPGTNFSLEVDGTSSEAFEKSRKTRLFERSVTPPNEKERRELRTMRSLDAMAEACTVAHRNDELIQLAELPAGSVPVEIGDAASSPNVRTSSTVKSQAPRRNLDSAETVHSCPSDMVELSRQDSVNETESHHTPPDGHKEDNTEHQTSNDPFDDQHAVHSSPPSPVRRVKLPFRPKVTPKTIEAATGFDTGLPNSEYGQPAMIEKGCSTARSSPAHNFEPIEGQMHMQRNLAFDEPIQRTEQRTPAQNPFEQAEELEDLDNVTSDDDTHTRARELLTSDIILPNYDSLDSTQSSPLEGMSPHAGPLVPQLYHRINQSQESSPRSARSRTTYTTGLGDTEHRFSFDSWLNESSSAPAPEDKPATPHRRRMDTSLDSVSTTEERKTPQISKATTNAERSPSMGNRIEFDLKRSRRNTRYNTIKDETTVARQDYWVSLHHTPPRFTVGGSEDAEGTEIQLADFESAYTGSREASPQQTTKTLSARVGSEDSVAESLKNAAHSYHQLEERLGEQPSGEDIFADPTESKNVSKSSPCAAVCSTGLFMAERARRSGSPSPRKNLAQEQLTPASRYGMRSRDFTPTLPRDNTSSIRFKGLTVMEIPESTSSPSYTETTVRPAPSSCSSTDTPYTFVHWQSKDRVASSDTLDESLGMFSSPDSGYQADKSSLSPEGSSASKSVPSRYRSKAKPKGRGSPLGEISKNIV